MKKHPKKPAKREPLARVESEEYGYYTLWILDVWVRRGTNKIYFMDLAKRINAAVRRYDTEIAALKAEIKRLKRGGK